MLFGIRGYLVDLCSFFKFRRDFDWAGLIALSILAEKELNTLAPIATEEILLVDTSKAHRHGTYSEACSRLAREATQNYLAFDPRNVA